MADDTQANASAQTGDFVPVQTPKSWALIEEGKVIELIRNFEFMHPFGDRAKDKRVLDVSGVPCAVGYVADHKGNVAAPLPNGEALLPHEPAYHDRGAITRPSAVYAQAMQTSEPHPLEKAENIDKLKGTNIRDVHPTAGLVQESPVKAKNEPD